MSVNQSLKCAKMQNNMGIMHKIKKVQKITFCSCYGLERNRDEGQLYGILASRRLSSHLLSLRGRCLEQEEDIWATGERRRTHTPLQRVQDAPVARPPSVALQELPGLPSGSAGRAIKYYLLRFQDILQKKNNSFDEKKPHVLNPSFGSDIRDKNRSFQNVYSSKSCLFSLFFTKALLAS